MNGGSYYYYKFKAEELLRAGEAVTFSGAQAVGRATGVLAKEAVGIAIASAREGESVWVLVGGHLAGPQPSPAPVRVGRRRVW